MSDYSKSTNFAAKDTLPVGNPAKVVRGTEIDAEFTAIATAVSTKADSTALTSGLALKADKATTVTAGSGLTGGGDLSANRTIALATGGVATANISDSAVTTAKIADANVTGAKLENSGVTSGSYGSALNIPVVTFDAKGRATNVSEVPVNVVSSGTAKAWVNFNGTGTVAIRAAFNVSSITDNGVGLYGVNFTNPMTDANYSVAVACGRPTPSNDGQAGISGTPAPTTVQVHATSAGDANFKDFDYMHVAIFR